MTEQPLPQNMIGDIHVRISVRAIPMASSPTIEIDVDAPSAYADEVKMLTQCATGCVECILAARRRPNDVPATPVTSSSGSSAKPSA